MSRLAPRAIALASAWTVACTVTRAHAELANEGVYNDALAHFRQAAAAWGEVAQGAAEQLFWSLAVISLSWTTAQLLLSRAELGDFAREVTQFLIFTGFWAWMMRNGPEHAELIITSLVELGGEMTGTQVTSPSGIFDLAFILADRMSDAQSLLGLADNVYLALLTMFMLLLLTWVSLLLLRVLIGGWVVAYVGVFVLGFGGAKWTSDMAINYYRTCLGIGLHALATIVLVGAGQSLIEGAVQRASEGGLSRHEAEVLTVIALGIALIVTKVPPQVSGLVVGGGLHQGWSTFDIPGSHMMARMGYAAMASGSGSFAGGASYGGGPAGGGGREGGPGGSDSGEAQRVSEAIALGSAVARDLVEDWFGRSPSAGGAGASRGGATGVGTGPDVFSAGSAYGPGSAPGLVAAGEGRPGFHRPRSAGLAASGVAQPGSAMGGPSQRTASTEPVAEHSIAGEARPAGDDRLAQGPGATGEAGNAAGELGAFQENSGTSSVAGAVWSAAIEPDMASVAVVASAGVDSGTGSGSAAATSSSAQIGPTQGATGPGAAAHVSNAFATPDVPPTPAATGFAGASLANTGTSASSFTATGAAQVARPAGSPPPLPAHRTATAETSHPTPLTSAASPQVETLPRPAVPPERRETFHRVLDTEITEVRNPGGGHD